MSARESFIKKAKPFILLHGLFLLYSIEAVFSKKAGESDFLSMPFILFYGISLAIMALYALFWQQIIKKIPLTTAFANKAITVVWGVIWGALLWKEKLTIGKGIGAVLVVAGVILFSLADKEESHE